MGSAKVSAAKPIEMSETPKKSWSLKSKIAALIWKDKKKDKHKKNEEPTKPKKEDTVAQILENFNNLVLEEKEDDDELKNFAYKSIEDDRESRVDRIDSHSSEDSGFKDDNEDVIEAFKDLKIESKKKKPQTVVISRGPIRDRVGNYVPSVDPYPSRQEVDYRQINQINKHTLSGGHVVVNEPASSDFTEVDLALKSVEKTSQKLQKDTETFWKELQEVIDSDTGDKNDNINNLLDFNVFHQEPVQTIQIVPTQTPEPNPIDEFANHQPSYDETLEMNTMLEFQYNFDDSQNSVFNTPPWSENSVSPLSVPPSSDYTLSPGSRSSPIYNSDYEKYQELTPIDDYEDEKRKLVRTPSTSSMTMKQYKDLQKDIIYKFTKRDCCQNERKSCRDIFQEHLLKLKTVERKNLCLKVAKLDLDTAFGVLHHIILSLAKGAEQEDLQLALFCMICERVLAQTPAKYADDFGLSLLKSAALRCPHRPLLTRYLVQCVRTALSIDPSLCKDKEEIFHEVDAQGDNLLLACARAGDVFADVLSELVRTSGSQPPLFRAHHVNSDGFTALHIACSHHSASSPHLHTVHVLLDHAGADLWKGDVKGGDTAVHLAVNSADCDLKLIMMLFKHVDRKVWKNLAHCRNMSSVTPIEYARSATKSTTRHNYPPEVLEFLKKCR